MSYLKRDRENVICHSIWMMRSDVFLSLKEATRSAVLDRVVKGEMTAAEGAARLGMSRRQIFRLKAKILTWGISSLFHGNRNRRPPNALSEETRSMVCAKAAGEYRGASLNHMSELLERIDGVRISAKTIGRILKDAGVANPHGRRRRKSHRSRERRERFGSLVQVDATPFEWLEDGNKWSLHGAIDDATGTVLSLRFEKNECSSGYLRVMEDMLGTWGVPAALYTDRHTIFFSPKKGEELSEEDIMEGRKVPLTRYGKMLDMLGIEHIPARSPQAKGRVERLWGTLQHRLLVEMRVAGVRTMEEANAFLPTYMELHNRLFTVEPADGATDFLPCPEPEKLRLILGHRDERKASAGSEISWQGKKYQLVDKKGEAILLRRGETVTAIRTSDDGLYALREGEGGTVYGLILSPSQDGKRKSTTAEKKERSERKTPSPSKDHPWRGSLKHRKQERPVYDDPDPLEAYDDAYTGSIYGVRVS